jgi:hypothetical protein
MENHFNLGTTSTMYVQQFTVALTNFERLVREERKYRRLMKARAARRS